VPASGDSEDDCGEQMDSPDPEDSNLKSVEAMQSVLLYLSIGRDKYY
jgi:hypothetical protein